LTHANSVGMPTRTVRGGMQPRKRLCRWDRHGCWAEHTAGHSTGRSRPHTASPSTPRPPGPTPLQTPRQRTSAPRAGSAPGQPAVAAGSNRSLRDRPHPSARRPCGATVTGHPSAGAPNWPMPSTMGDQLGQPRSTRKQRTVSPLIVPARYSFLYASSTPACSGRPCADHSRAGRPRRALWSRPETPPFMQLLGRSGARLLLVAVDATIEPGSGCGHAYVGLP
jgi:hypothetical protein